MIVVRELTPTSWEVTEIPSWLGRLFGLRVRVSRIEIVLQLPKGVDRDSVIRGRGNRVFVELPDDRVLPSNDPRADAIRRRSVDRLPAAKSLRSGS